VNYLFDVWISRRLRLLYRGIIIISFVFDFTTIHLFAWHNSFLHFHSILIIEMSIFRFNNQQRVNLPTITQRNGSTLSQRKDINILLYSNYFVIHRFSWCKCFTISFNESDWLSSISTYNKIWRNTNRSTRTTHSGTTEK